MVEKEALIWVQAAASGGLLACAATAVPARLVHAVWDAYQRLAILKNPLPPIGTERNGTEFLGNPIPISERNR